MAAAALRTARKAAPGDDRNAHFSLAASYKSLAHDDEWMCGERQRSHKRNSQPKKPKKRLAAAPLVDRFRKFTCVLREFLARVVEFVQPTLIAL